MRGLVGDTPLGNIEGGYERDELDFELQPLMGSNTAVDDRSQKNRTMAVSGLTASLLCAAVWTATGSTRLATLALIPALAVALLTTVVGARPALIAACLCVAPPGLIGENYGWVAAVAVAFMWIAVVTTPVETTVIFPVVPLLVAVAAAALLIASVAANEPETKRAISITAILYLGAAAVTLELARRPALARSALRALTLIIAATCASFIASAFIGFAGTRDVLLPFRDISFAPPFTFFTDNKDYLPVPRFNVISGEPGLGAVYLVIAATCSILLERGRRRAILLALIGTGVVVNQSTGLLFAIVAMIGAIGFVAIARKIAVLAAIVVAVAAVPVVRFVVSALIDHKEQRYPISVTVRGFSGQEADTSISLSALWAHNPIIVVPLVALLGYLLFVTVRRPVQFGAVAAVTTVAWFAQPLQYHPGVWVMLAATVIATVPGRKIQLTTALPP